MKEKFKILFTIVATAFFLFVPLTHAQNAITLTITPPFFELNVSPGEFWASSIKVVNTNPGDLPVYVTVMDFASVGEEGHGRFVPVSANGDASNSLASWIKLTGGSHFTVPKGQSRDISFSLQVPNDASPGGHYAAILVGTQPADPAQGSGLKVSSYISSLFFVRVSGDVHEQGDIREFSTDSTFYSDPNAHFTVRFENKGNVHLHPEGNIAIHDMWGKQVGQILVNNDNEFGNVLPDSIRRYDFSWKGESGLSGLGRYTATVTLTYGDTSRQNVFRAVSFWVIPVWEVSGILGGSATLIFFIVFIVKWYVRRTLAAVHGRSGREDDSRRRMPTRSEIRSAFEAGATLDLRALREKKETPPAKEKKTLKLERIFLIRKYKWFFAVLVSVLIVAALWYAVYFWQAFKNGRTIEITTGSENVPALPPGQ